MGGERCGGGRQRFERALVIHRHHSAERIKDRLGERTRWVNRRHARASGDGRQRDRPHDHLRGAHQGADPADRDAGDDADHRPVPLASSSPRVRRLRPAVARRGEPLRLARRRPGCSRRLGRTGNERPAGSPARRRGATGGWRSRLPCPSQRPVTIASAIAPTPITPRVAGMSLRPFMSKYPSPLKLDDAP